MAFNPDPAASMFDTYFGSMPCANTAALQEKTMNDRDATAAEEAELNERVKERARQIGIEEFFATDVISDIEQSWFQSIGGLSIDHKDDMAFAIAVGQKIVHAIRDRAIAAAKKELNA